MNTVQNEYLEYREEIPETIVDYKGLRKAIVEFKEENAIKILNTFFEEAYSCGEKVYSRFLPAKTSIIDDSEDTGTHNIGIFSTALCLETIASYAKKVDGCKKTVDGSFWVWTIRRDRRVAKGNRREQELSPEDLKSKKIEEQRQENRRKLVNDKYGREKAYAFFDFIIDGLIGKMGAKLGFLAKIATLVRFGNYLNNWEIKEHFIDNADLQVKKDFFEICVSCICDFQNRFSTKKEGIHPFELYRFLQFIRIWGTELSNYSIEQGGLCEIIAAKVKLGKENLKPLEECLCEAIMRSVGKPPLGRMIFKYFFEEVYLFAKYELYRQMALKHSGDSRLYDAKRLIYSLLIVSLENRFSNTLIRNRALELIFAPYKEDRNAIWPTGQQVAMSKDGLMIVSDNECVCDLLGCDYLSKSLLNFMTELKCIYDGYSRTKRVVDGKITGWYPVHQRDQTPKSWTTALTLSFIKKFCKLVSLELSRKAKEKFRSNYRKTKIDWHEIYDCTAVKAKIRLMFPEGDILSKRATGGEIDILQDCKYRTAILFGPPGTGKTTYGRGIAAKLELDYLELTPGDFFAGGEDSILVSINDIFEHLLHLKNTVVFIDEIDDLVKDRNPIVKDKIENSHQPYDPRTLFVNSLLPRFQELHDQGNIILLMATNNIERVDKAITRMGRVDLVIPVGSISPHGRLKYIQKIIDNNNDVFNGLLRVEPETKLSILIDYLNATEGFNYGTLKHYCEVVIDEIRKIDSKDPIVICEEIVKRFNAQAKRKAPNNPMWIWKDDVIEKNRDNDYDTRPRHTEGDFYDFGHFDVREGGPYPISKKEFQEKFVYLYYYLNVHNNYASSADTIQQIINNYCNDFPINEKGETRMFKERLYNIMTPFYDDIESAIKKVDAADKRTKNKLLRSKDQIGDLIFGRSILPTD